MRKSQGTQRVCNGGWDVFGREGCVLFKNARVRLCCARLDNREADQGASSFELLELGRVQPAARGGELAAEEALGQS